MKKSTQIVILAAAGVAAYMILRNANAATGQATGGKYTAAANPYSPWFGYEYGALNLPGYSLFDGAMDSLGLTSTNTGYGTTGNGLGLKPGNGWGLSYGGVTAAQSSGGVSGSW